MLKIEFRKGISVIYRNERGIEFHVFIEGTLNSITGKILWIPTECISVAICNQTPEWNGIEFQFRPIPKESGEPNTP